MNLTEKQIEEYRELYHKVYGKEISKEQAYVKALALGQFVKDVLKGKYEIEQKEKEA